MVEGKTLLYIDDDKAILHMVGGYFEDLGYTVFLTEDGEEGLNEFKSNQPDIVLVDLRMPNIDGFEVLRYLSKHSPDTPAIVISGEGEMADVIQALRLGAWNYHTKPIDNLTLIKHTVEQALEKARLVEENKTYQRGLESKIAGMADNFPGFIYSCNKGYQLTYMNPALTNYLGNNSAGENCYTFIYGSKKKCPWCPAEKLSMGGQVSKQEILNPQDGRWYHAIHIPILDNKKELIERQVVLYDITERKQALLDLEEREEYLRKENILLKSASSGRYKLGDIIGKSAPMQEIYETILNAASTEASVIIYGESGTGKELVARAIHNYSDRKKKELVYVNCGAIPESLIESEFFGYKKGAFTGATTNKFGFLDIADGSTLFLDEVGEIPLSMQVKLLRAIEGNGYTPVGGTEVKKPDIRIIAATNRDLKTQVRDGHMRQDFLYRIHIIPILVPPLRERKDDIPMLVDHFLENQDPVKIPPVTAAITKALLAYDWPGNVRELQNTLHRFVTLKKLDFMGQDISLESTEEEQQGLLLAEKDRPLAEILSEVEKKILLKACEKYKYHQSKTAKALHIDRKTLYRKLKQFGISEK